MKANCPELKGQESGKPVALVTGEEVRPPGQVWEEVGFFRQQRTKKDRIGAWGFKGFFI